MSSAKRKGKLTPLAKGGEAAERLGPRLARPAVGMEAEFDVYVDGVRARPEDVFGDPRAFLPDRVVHRRGTSYNVATGAAVYFDTGVIEVATPVIELERGCAARAARSLWESILLVRSGLDAWERRAGRDVRLAGFSTHYNVSFEPRPGRSNARLARLLAYVLPAPMMLLATNRRSTGVGVRPRGDRVEVTVDFTPDPALMVAAGTLVAGVVRAAMRLGRYDLGLLDELGLPVVRGFAPMPHTSRKGWLARFDCYPENPFAAGPDARIWEVGDAYWRRRGEPPRQLSLREIARAIYERFRRAVARVADPLTLALIDAVLEGRAPSLLDLDDRPAAYDDVGRLCSWSNLYPERVLPRSRYERVLMGAIAGRAVRLDGLRYRPVRVLGWTHVVLECERSGREFAVPIDALDARLEEWEGEWRSHGSRRRSRS